MLTGYFQILKKAPGSHISMYILDGRKLQSKNYRGLMVEREICYLIQQQNNPVLKRRQETPSGMPLATQRRQLEVFQLQNSKLHFRKQQIHLKAPEIPIIHLIFTE